MLCASASDLLYPFLSVVGEYATITYMQSSDFLRLRLWSAIAATVFVLALNAVLAHI
jgi:hypothetical protein